MRNLLIGLIAVCSILLIGYFFIFPESSAQKFARNQWEYAAIRTIYTIYQPKDRVSRIPGMAEICYLQPAGCKSVEIKHELDYGAFLQERGLPETTATREQANSAACEIAFQKAMTQLGNEGWELVNAPKLSFESQTLENYNKYENKSYLFQRDSTEAIYFKRMKSQ